MDADDFSQGQSEAVEHFNRCLRRQDGLRVASSLSAGLSVLRDLLYARLHDDVERVIGRDSMLIPVSELKARKLCRREIDVYQAAESAIAAREFGYVDSLDWYAQWLRRLRKLDISTEPSGSDRVDEYLADTAQSRLSRFESRLAKFLPESTRAPLVVFRLFPLAVRIATAQAFADHGRATRIRHDQSAVLPSILDCRGCHGKVLENGEQCVGCGNPLWKYSWLVAD